MSHERSSSPADEPQKGRPGWWARFGMMVVHCYQNLDPNGLGYCFNSSSDADVLQPPERLEAEDISPLVAAEFTEDTATWTAVRAFDHQLATTDDIVTGIIDATLGKRRPNEQ